MYHVSLVVQCIYGWSDEVGEDGELSFWKIGEGGGGPEDGGGMVAEVCRRRGLKVNASKRKVMVLNGEEGLECEVHVNGIRLEHISEFKYLGCVLDESGRDGPECSKKVASRRRGAGTIRSLVNARDLQLEYARVFHETLFVPVLMYGSKTMLWKEKESSRVRAVQMDNLRGLLGIRRMDRVPNTWIRELCGMKQGLDERIDEGILKWFGHVERDRIAKSVYVGVLVVVQCVSHIRDRLIP